MAARHRFGQRPDHLHVDDQDRPHSIRNNEKHARACVCPARGTRTGRGDLVVDAPGSRPSVATALRRILAPVEYGLVHGPTERYKSYAPSTSDLSNQLNRTTHGATHGSGLPGRLDRPRLAVPASGRAARVGELRQAAARHDGGGRRR